MKAGMTLWLIGAGVGVLIILGSVIGLTGAILVGLLVIPLARRPGGAWAIAGTLTGFGSVWLFLMLRQAASGGQLDNATFWTAVGVVPLVVGLAWTTALGRYRLRDPDTE